MTATKIWRRSSRRFVPAKQRISKCAPSSYASKNEHGPMRSSSCLPIRSSNIWPPAGAPSTSPWKKDSKPLRRSVSSKYHQKMPPAITASPHLVPPLPTYCIAQTSSSPRSSPSLGLVCPRRKNSNQNDLFCEFSYLARIIHQPKKSTRENPFGGQMILTTLISQDHHAPKARSSDGLDSVQSGLSVVSRRTSSWQPPRADHHRFVRDPPEVSMALTGPATSDAPTLTTLHSALRLARLGTTRATKSGSVLEPLARGHPVSVSAIGSWPS